MTTAKHDAAMARLKAGQSVPITDLDPDCLRQMVPIRSPAALVASAAWCVAAMRLMPVMEQATCQFCGEALRYDAKNDETPCLRCSEEQLVSMRSALGTYQTALREPPRAEHMDQAGEPGRCDFCGDPASEGECAACQRFGVPCANGNRGEMKHGDPDDCRCADCSGDRIDAAMDAMGDR